MLRFSIIVLFCLIVTGCSEDEVSNSNRTGTSNDSAGTDDIASNDLLMKCSDCGKDVSKRAVSCPHCGAPLRTNSIIEATPSMPKPRMTEVRGVVIFDGKPLGDATVVIYPDGGDGTAKPADGKTDAQGNFSLTTTFPDGEMLDGAFEGSYTLFVVKYEQMEPPDDQGGPPADDAEPSSEMFAMMGDDLDPSPKSLINEIFGLVYPEDSSWANKCNVGDFDSPTKFTITLNSVGRGNVAVVGLGSIGQSRPRNDAQFVLRAEDMQLLPEQPSWIRENVLQSVVKQHNLEELFLDDSNLTKQLADAFTLHSWILCVESVEKSPTGVVVRVNYRKPVAMVEVKFNDRPHVLPIDAGGTVLPPGDFNGDDISNYLRIAADHLRPSGNVGDPWGMPKWRVRPN